MWSLILMLTVMAQPANQSFAAGGEPILPVRVSTGGTAVGAWSDPVDGLQARLSTSLQTLPKLQRDVLATYIELHNISSTAPEMRIPWDTHKKLTFELVDSSGTQVPKQQGPYDELSHRREFVFLPKDSYLRLKIGPRGHGVPGNPLVILDLGADTAWAINRESEKDYYLKATLNVAPQKEPRSQHGWHGTLVIPPVRISPREWPEIEIISRNRN